MRRPLARAALAAALLGAAGCASSAAPPSAANPVPVAGWERRVAPFAVADAAGRPYAMPFLGGLNVPRPQLADIDADGDLDLFVQERSNELMFFENVGTARAPSFVWRTDRWQDLEIGEWSRIVDVDGDGDPDVLAERPYSYIRLFRNDGTAAAPRYVAAADTIRDAAGAAIFADRQNLPGLHDVDCDGATDLLLGRVDGTITHYEQVPGGAGPPVFRFEGDRWQGIEIIGQVAPTPDAPGPTLRHGANAMAFQDLDGDGDADLLWGDFFEPGVLVLENTTGCPMPVLPGPPRPLTVADAAGGADTLLTSGYNVPVPADLDGDGAPELLLGILGGAFNPNRTAADNLWMLTRGAGGAYTLRTRRFLDGIDVGAESAPALADLDGDGDLDLLVGNKIDPATVAASRVYRFENVGTRDAPAFRLADTLSPGAAYHYAPAVADLDGDGAPDLVLGTWQEGVQWIRNAGGRNGFDVSAAPRELVRLPRGSNATPALADLDDDGDLDLLVGEASGDVNLFRNDGTRTAPSFTLVSERFQGIDAGRRSAPALADLDGDGRPDLVVGREDGGALFLRNVTAPGGEIRFEPMERVLPLHPYGAPALGDVDGDGRLDVIAGALSGGLLFFAGR